MSQRQPKEDPDGTLAFLVRWLEERRREGRLRESVRLLENLSKAVGRNNKGAKI